MSSKETFVDVRGKKGYLPKTAIILGSVVSVLGVWQADCKPSVGGEVNPKIVAQMTSGAGNGKCVLDSAIVPAGGEVFVKGTEGLSGEIKMRGEYSSEDINLGDLNEDGTKVYIRRNISRGLYAVRVGLAQVTCKTENGGDLEVSTPRINFCSFNNTSTSAGGTIRVVSDGYGSYVTLRGVYDSVTMFLPAQLDINRNYTDIKIPEYVESGVYVVKILSPGEEINNAFVCKSPTGKDLFVK